MSTRSPGGRRGAAAKSAQDEEVADNLGGDAGAGALDAAAGLEEALSSLGSDMDSQLREDPEQADSILNDVADTSKAGDSPILDAEVAALPDSESAAESSDSQSPSGWVRRFLEEKGNEFFCEIDDEYIGDRFNLTGLNTEVENYQFVLDLLSDNLDEPSLDQVRDQEDIQLAARHLYGLIHSRYVITHRGLSKMAEKYRKEEFGRCPRALCQNQAVLPIGLTDIPEESFAKVYCPRCEDVYSPASKRHARIDGAYFGTTFAHLIFQVFPNLIPAKATERFVPRIFGFKIHEVAAQHRRQDALKERKSQALSAQNANGGHTA